MSSEEESRTPPLPSSDNEQYTPPKIIYSCVKVAQTQKVEKTDRSSKKKIKIKKQERTVKHEKRLEKSKKSSKSEYKTEALVRSCEPSRKLTLMHTFQIPESFLQSTEVKPSIYWSENPRYIPSSTPPPPPKPKVTPIETPQKKSLSPATPPLPITSKSPDTDEYETKWESDEDSALRRNLDEYYQKIGIKLESDKLKAAKVDEKLEQSIDDVIKPLIELEQCDKKKFTMSLKKPEILCKNLIIKPKIFLDDAIEDEVQPICDKIEVQEIKVDENLKQRNRSTSRDDRRTYKRSNRSSSRDRRERRGERGERKKNDDDYEFAANFNYNKKPDQKLNESEAAKCSQVLTDYLNPVFSQNYQPPPPPPMNGNSPKMQWPSLDARLEMIKNDEPQPTFHDQYNYAYNHNFYYQQNYAVQPVQVNPNLISIKSQEPTPSFVVVGNVLEIVPIAQPPLPPAIVNKPPPPPPELPKPVPPPPPIEKSPAVLKMEQKQVRRQKRREERTGNIAFLKNAISELNANRENRVRQEIEKELEEIPVETPRAGILLNRTIPQPAAQPMDVCRSFRDEKVLRDARPQKSVIYGDGVRPNYDEAEYEAELWRERVLLKAEILDRAKKNEAEMKKQKLLLNRRRKTDNLMEGFKVPKPILKLRSSTSTATSTGVNDITHEPRKPQSADLKNLEFYYNLPPPGPPPGRPPAHVPQPVELNPEPDKHLYFHAYPKTGQMVISPFPEGPDWPMIVGQLKDDGTALVCTPNMLQRDPRKNLPSQSVPPILRPASYFGPRPQSKTGQQGMPPLHYFGPRPPFFPPQN